MHNRNHCNALFKNAVHMVLLSFTAQNAVKYKHSLLNDSKQTATTRHTCTYTWLCLWTWLSDTMTIIITTPPNPALLCVGTVLSVYKLPNSFGWTSHHGSRVVITVIMMMLMEMVIMYHPLPRIPNSSVLCPPPPLSVTFFHVQWISGTRVVS